MSGLKPRVEIDRHTCIGAGICTEIAPESFSLDSDGKAIFDETADVDRATLLDAQQACPSGAIVVREQEG